MTDSNLDLDARRDSPLALSGCSKRTPPTPEPTAAASTLAAGASVKATPEAKRRAHIPNGKASANTKWDLSSYTSALAAGRAATIAKKSDDAERAFTKALSFRSMDTRGARGDRSSR